MNTSNAPGAVILGGGFVGLGAARALAKHAVPVTVVDPETCLCQFSNSIQRVLHSPPTENEAAYVDFLERAASAEHLAGAVLFPTIDDGVSIVSQQWQRLSRSYRLTLPDWDTVRYLHDKRLLPQLANRQSVPIPTTCVPAGPEELTKLNFGFPVILKPAVSTRLKVLTGKKAYRANNPAELMAAYTRLASLIDPGDILVQEFIPGGANFLYSFFGYFKQGELVAGYSARRLRQDPMDFGRLTTYAMTVDVPKLEELSVRLLSGVGYTGLAEVEFMYDAKHTRFELIEVNPRLWGWHTLAVHAGMDLPYLAYADTLQLPYMVGQFHPGVRWVRLTGDLPLALKELFAGRLKPLEYLRSLWGSRDAVLSWTDPLAFPAEVSLTAIHMLKNWGERRRIRGQG